jgi:hypothetical protein
MAWCGQSTKLLEAAVLDQSVVRCNHKDDRQMTVLVEVFILNQTDMLAWHTRSLVAIWKHFCILSAYFAQDCATLSIRKFSKLYAYACIYAAKMQIWKLFLVQLNFLSVSNWHVI